MMTRTIAGLLLAALALQGCVTTGQTANPAEPPRPWAKAADLAEQKPGAAPTRDSLEGSLWMAVDKMEKDIPGTMAQDRADIVAGQPVFVVGATDRRLRHSVQTRQTIVKGKAQRIQQGAFASTGGAGDGEQPSLGQRCRFQVDFEGAGQTGEVTAANGENFHGAASPVSRPSSSSRKQPSTSSGGSPS